MAGTGGVAPSSAVTSTAWEDLRSQARRIERNIDRELSTLLESPEADKKIVEIESMLRKLSELHDAMQRYASQTPTKNQGILLTLQRHRELWAGMHSDLRAAKRTLTAARQREELLGGVRVEVDTTRSDLLLRERASIHNSERIAETVLGQAIAARDALEAQRIALTGAMGRLFNMGQRLPVIGGLIGRIGRRRWRDTLIIAAVVAICITLLILYLVSGRS